MKVRIINKDGMAWDFPSMEAARPHIRKDRLKDYTLEPDPHTWARPGRERMMRVYDDREPVSRISAGGIGMEFKLKRWR